MKLEYVIAALRRMAEDVDLNLYQSAVCLEAADRLEEAGESETDTADA